MNLKTFLIPLIISALYSSCSTTSTLPFYNLPDQSVQVQFDYNDNVPLEIYNSFNKSIDKFI